MIDFTKNTYFVKHTSLQIDISSQNLIMRTKYNEAYGNALTV